MAENRGLAVRSEQPADIMQYDGSRYNVLAPITAIRTDMPYLKARPVVVKLDPDTEKGDCYPAPGSSGQKVNGVWVSDKVSPAKAGLMKIASAMGAQWRVERITPQSQVLLQEMARNGAPASTIRELYEASRYDCAYRVVLAVPEGIGYRYIEASYEWDLESQRRKIAREGRKRLENSQKVNKSFDLEEYILKREDEVISERFGLAESKAILRAIRATGVRHQYTRQEFALPFVVQRVELVPDMDDPEVRKALADRLRGATAELYGGPRALPAATGQPDFDGAIHSGLTEQAPPLDEGEEVVGDQPALPAPTNADDEQPGPWDADPSPPAPAPAPAQNGPPTREQAIARWEGVWKRVVAAKEQGKLADYPPAVKATATAEELVVHCDATEQLLQEAGAA